MPKKSNRKGSSGYEVGYKKPPKKTQFQPGQSGNPKGRPRGKKNVSTYVQEILITPTKITVNGESKNLPAYAGAVYAVLQRAMQGEARALTKVLELANAHAPDHIAEEVEAEVERRVKEFTDQKDQQFRDLMDRLTPGQKKRLAACMSEMKKIEAELDERSGDVDPDN